MANTNIAREQRQVLPTQSSSRPPSAQISLKTWIAVLGGTLGAFMAILDVQIANSSLDQIEGSLGATLDEGSWISTSYLIAEVMVIPLTGWLSQVFSVRWYLLVNSTLFLFFSVCCAQAWDLPSMIVFRALQGFTGGVMIPMSFTIVLTTLPPVKQPIGIALFSIAASVGPSMGPTIGGWLTDNLGWQYDFYLNIVPGIILIGIILYAVPSQPLHLDQLKQGDWWGILSMALGLGSLEVVLEEGNRKDWFGSQLIVRYAIIAGIFLTLFLWIELTRRKPFINLRLLRRHNFCISSATAVTFGVGLYGTIYLLPLYLAQIRDYSALQIGEVIMWAGLPQLMLIPLVPKLMQRLDVRLLGAVGFSLFAVSCFMNSTMTHDTGMDELRWSQLVRAGGQALIVVPLSSMATGNIEKEQAGSASALFNVVRNLGGSIGIAMLATLLTRREQFHSNRLGEAVSLYEPETQQRLEQMTQFFVSRGSDLSTASEQALKAIDNIVRRESYVMAYNDCFYLMGIALLLSGLALIFCKKAKAGGGEAAH